MKVSALPSGIYFVKVNTEQGVGMVKVAVEQGLVGMICHAVDGTKIAAVASRRTVEHREDLEKLLARVEAGLAETEAAVDGPNRGGPCDGNQSSRCGQAGY